MTVIEGYPDDFTCAKIEKKVGKIPFVYAACPSNINDPYKGYKDYIPFGYADTFIMEWLEPIYDLLTDDGTLVIACFTDFTANLINEITMTWGWYKAGWIPAIRDVIASETQWRNTYSQIFVFRKNSFNTTKLPPIQDDEDKWMSGISELSHRPKLLSWAEKRIIETMTSPRDIIVDGFAGCGSFSVEAEKLGRKTVSVENDETLLKHLKKLSKK